MYAVAGTWATPHWRGKLPNCAATCRLGGGSALPHPTWPRVLAQIVAVPSRHPGEQLPVVIVQCPADRGVVPTVTVVVVGVSDADRLAAIVDRAAAVAWLDLIAEDTNQALDGPAVVVGVDDVHRVGVDLAAFHGIGRGGGAAVADVLALVAVADRGHPHAAARSCVHVGGGFARRERPYAGAVAVGGVVEPIGVGDPEVRSVTGGAVVIPLVPALVAAVARDDRVVL